MSGASGKTVKPDAPIGRLELRYQERCQEALTLLETTIHAGRSVSGHTLLSALLGLERAFMAQEGTLSPAPIHTALEALIVDRIDRGGER